MKMVLTHLDRIMNWGSLVFAMFTLQLDVGAEYSNASVGAHRTPTEKQDDLEYATVSFSKQEEDPIYSNVTPAQQHKQKNTREEEEEEDEEGVEYSTVNCKSGSNNPGWVHSNVLWFH